MKTSSELLNTRTPFHEGIYLYEQNDPKSYKEAFKLFYLLFKTNNLFVVHYIQDMLDPDNKQISAELRTELQAIFNSAEVVQSANNNPAAGAGADATTVTASDNKSIVRADPLLQKQKTLSEMEEKLKARLASSPKMAFAQNFLLASKFIQKINILNRSVEDKNSKSKIKKYNAFHKQLFDLLPTASNAALYFLNLIEANTKLEHENEYYLKRIYNCADMFVIAKLKNISRLPQSSTEAWRKNLQKGWEENKLEQEWVQIQKCVRFAYPKASTSLIPELPTLFEEMMLKTPNLPFIRIQRWTLQAARMGSKEMQFAIFSSLLPTQGFDPEDFHLWQDCAALSGVAFAKLMVGIRCFGRPIPPTPVYLGPKNQLCADLQYLEEGLKNQDSFSSSKITRLEVNDILRDANYIMGALYFYGDTQGVDQDYTKALFYLQKANALKAQHAPFLLGMLYSSNINTIDYKLAIEFFELAIAGKSPLTSIVQAKLGLLYAENTNKMERDYTKAISYLKMAMMESAILGDELSMRVQTVYARLLHEGNGIKPNKEEAMTLLKNLADKKYPYAAFMLVAIYFRKIRKSSRMEFTPTEIKNYLDYAKEYPPITLYYGLYYLTYAEPKDVKLAYTYFTEVVQNNKGNDDHIGWSLFELARLQAAGVPELNIAADPKIAYELLTQAANKGSSLAVHDQGHCLLNGIGVKEDRKAAKACFEKSLDLGILDSAFSLAGYYTHKDNCDPKQAFEYLKQAEPLNIPEVYFFLGMFYQFGFGTEKDTAQAVFYYEKPSALQYGSEAACRNYVRTKVFLLLKKGAFFTKDKEELQTLHNELKSMQARIGNNKFNDLMQEDVLFAILGLTINPNQAKNILPIIFENIAKPYPNVTHCLQKKTDQYYLDNNDLLLLLLCVEEYMPETWCVEQIESIIKKEHDLAEMSKKADLDAKANNVVKTALPSTKKDNLKSETTLPAAAGAGSDAKVSISNTLRFELNTFIDPLNFKKIKLETLNLIIKKLVNACHLLATVKTSKGSNINYKLTDQESSKAIHFSFHPLHRRNQKGNAFDPNRAKSLQKFAQEILALTKPASS